MEVLQLKVKNTSKNILELKGSDLVNKTINKFLDVEVIGNDLDVPNEVIYLVRFQTKDCEYEDVIETVKLNGKRGSVESFLGKLPDRFSKELLDFPVGEKTTISNYSVFLKPKSELIISFFFHMIDIKNEK